MYGREEIQESQNAFLLAVIYVLRCLVFQPGVSPNSSIRLFKVMTEYSWIASLIEI
jgi:hypothetical protein